MRILYDPEADALQIEFIDDPEVRDSTDLEDGITAELDAEGHIVALEVLDAKKRFGPSVESIVVERLVPGSAEQAAAR